MFLKTRSKDCCPMLANLAPPLLLQKRMTRASAPDLVRHLRRIATLQLLTRPIRVRMIRPASAL